MNLAQVVTAYVTHRQAMGMRFRTEARILQSFSRALGDLRTIKEITADQLLAFLAGAGPVTRNWERKHSALGGLYRFAVARGYVDHSPLPRSVPRPQEAFVPYIYSHEELRRLLDAVAANDHPRCHIDPDTYRTILLLLYGAGLRISEALALTMADVDLNTGVLCIRDSKFYKSRLVPIGDDLRQILAPRRKAPTAACRGRIALLCLPQGHCGDPARCREGLLPPAGPCRRRTRIRRCPTSAALARPETHLCRR
jgi:integrase/recombinase XerD